MTAAEHEVVIAGGGPTGMMLAAELALAGIDVAIVERRADHVIEGSRAGGLHARTIEVLDQRGVADRFLAEGKPAQAAMLGGTVLDISDFPTRHPYALGLWQSEIERIMAAWVAELPVQFHRGREVTGFAQDESGVLVALADGELRARYLVGCDGGRSLVRKQAGIGFPGWEPSTSTLIAEAETREEPAPGIQYDEKGIHAIGPLGDGRRVRVVIRAEQVEGEGEPTLDDVREALIAARGTDYGIHSATWVSRFNDATRQAETYRAGRVLLAGDAAHIHYPAGGQGLNLGVQDAVNLGWKLAQVVRGVSPETLLDTYEAERHPVAARAMRLTMAQTALQRGGERMAALREIVGELAGSDEARRRFGGQLSGLDIHYDLGEGHPLLGRRMPDLDLETATGPGRVFELLHPARPLLLDLSGAGAFDGSPWAARVELFAARCDERWELPVIGEVDAPAVVLVRPDGYVAWVGELGEPSLEDALTTWFGRRPARSPRP